MWAREWLSCHLASEAFVQYGTAREKVLLKLL